jgi:hypothetical protein
MDFTVILSRALFVSSSEQVLQRVFFEIGLPSIVTEMGAGQAGTVEAGPARAGWRLRPLEDWHETFGEDAVQAVQLAIQFAELVAEDRQLHWPDGSIFSRTPAFDRPSGTHR